MFPAPVQRYLAVAGPRHVQRTAQHPAELGLVGNTEAAQQSSHDIGITTTGGRMVGQNPRGLEGAIGSGRESNDLVTEGRREYRAPASHYQKATRSCFASARRDRREPLRMRAG